MNKRRSVVTAIILFLLVFTTTVVYGAKGVTWLQKKNILPSFKESTEVYGEISEGCIYIGWKPIESSEIQGYKVVISENHPYPEYPLDGYLIYTIDPEVNRIKIDNSIAYTNGDFGKYLVPGKEYYFSVTAIYLNESKKGNAVKLTFPEPMAEEKEEIEYTASVISGTISDGGVILSFIPINDERLKGYKVVISEENPEPSYPEDGYYRYITDLSCDSVFIGADPKKNLVPGKEYYFSITAVYNQMNVAGNAVKLRLPETDKQFEARVEKEQIYLNWSQENAEDFQGYKIVISKNDETPAYPDDGYLYWITDPLKTTTVIDNKTEYHGGDIGGYLKPGESYYFSVTYVYKDRKEAAEAMYLKVPDGIYTPQQEVEQEKEVLAWVKDGVIKMSWSKGIGTGFQGYKVVVSKNDETPAYPDDGYLYWITDPLKTTTVIDNKTEYHGGDIGGYLKPGESYYFSVTYVYKDMKEAAEAVLITTPEGF